MKNLWLPLQHISINQPFGANYVDFYQTAFNPPLLGHPGIDFKAFEGCPVRAVHDGVCYWSGVNMPDGGRMVSVWDEANRFKTIYYHLSEWLVNQGDIIKKGQVIGLAGNTGKLTTGAHLHLEGKETTANGSTANPNNGYNGAIDISRMFTNTFDGQEINPKDYDKSRCYHRYYRGRPKGGLFNETKILTILGKKGIYPTAEKINALVYGGWGLDAVTNPAMYINWSQLKKDEFIKGIRSFQ